MNKLKDIFYDKHDILVAVVILIIAALVILWRVDAIMAYPQTLVASAAGNEDIGADNTPSGTDTTGSAVSDPNGTSGSAIDNIEICAIYVNYGESLDVVAQNCVAAGLVGSTDEFMTAVNSMGAGGAIQAGQHHIPSNVTPEELVQYLMQPGL